jgi:predicted DNA-binding transcriptional regulator YafY
MSTSGWWDVKRWILSFGADAKVLEPIELRKEIVEELSAAVSPLKRPIHDVG